MGDCTFCEQPATCETYISPAMCERHILAAVIVARLQALRLPLVAENIRQIVALHPQLGLTADEAITLCRSMESDNGALRV